MFYHLHLAWQDRTRVRLDHQTRQLLRCWCQKQLQAYIGPNSIRGHQSYSQGIRASIAIRRVDGGPVDPRDQHTLQTPWPQAVKFLSHQAHVQQQSRVKLGDESQTRENQRHLRPRGRRRGEQFRLGEQHLCIAAVATLISTELDFNTDAGRAARLPLSLARRQSALGVQTSPNHLMYKGLSQRFESLERRQQRVQNRIRLRR